MLFCTHLPATWQNRKSDFLVALDCMYCKSGNFRESFIFVNSDLRHICDDKNSRLEHDLPILVNGRVILPFARILFSWNLAYAKFRENKTLAQKISEFTVVSCVIRKWIFTYKSIKKSSKKSPSSHPFVLNNNFFYPITFLKHFVRLCVCLLIAFTNSLDSD